MTTDTTNFAFTRPSESENDWDTTLNACIQEIDTKMFVSIDTDGTLKAGAVDVAAVVASDILTHAQIINRTRTIFVPATGAQDITTLGAYTTIDHLAPYGRIFPDLSDCAAYGAFYIPSDYASSMTVKAVVQAGSAGNLYGNHIVYSGANGEAYNTHTDTTGLTTAAVTENVIAEIFSVSATSIAAGDYVSLYFTRYGSNASDTITDTVYFKGWLVSYTADM